MEELYISILVCSFLFGAFAAYEVGQSKKRYKKLEQKFNELAIKTGNPELATTFIAEEKPSTTGD